MPRYAIAIHNAGVFFEDAPCQDDAVFQLEGKYAGITDSKYSVYQYSPDGIAPEEFSKLLVAELNAMVFARQREFTAEEKAAARITVNGELVTGFQVGRNGAINLITHTF